MPISVTARSPSTTVDAITRVAFLPPSAISSADRTLLARPWRPAVLHIVVSHRTGVQIEDYCRHYFGWRSCVRSFLPTCNDSVTSGLQPHEEQGSNLFHSRQVVLSTVCRANPSHSRSIHWYPFSSLYFAAPSSVWSAACINTCPPFHAA